MNIQKIEICNIASIEGPEIIDLTKEPLASAGIFCITGPTGSGKSTLLDAICLALFDDSPRFSNVTETSKIDDVSGESYTIGDSRKALREGCGSGFAKVTFTGVDGISYEAKWEVSRARGKANGRLQPVKMSLENLKTGTLTNGNKKEVQSAIEEKLGLTFSQFTKSVILPQGEFGALLKAKEEHKAEMLEKITGTEIYGKISKSVFELHKVEKNKLELLESRKSTIRLLAPEELLELNNLIQLLEKSIETKKDNLEKLKLELTWHHRLAELNQQTEQALRNLEAVLLEETQIQNRKALLKQIEQVQETRNWMENLKKEETNIKNLHDDIQRLTLEINNQQQEKQRLEVLLDEANKRVSESNAAQKAAEPLIKEATELDRELALKSESLQNLTKETAEARKKLLEQMKAVDGLKEELASLAEKTRQFSEFLNENESRKIIAEQIQRIELSLKQGEELLRKTAAHKAALSSLKDKIPNLTSEKEKTVAQNTALNKQQLELQQEVNTLQQNQETLKLAEVSERKEAHQKAQENLIKAQTVWEKWQEKSKSLSSSWKEVEILNRQIADLKVSIPESKEKLSSIAAKKAHSEELLAKYTLLVSENVTSLRAHLQPEHECPVCGSLEHPYREHHPNSDNQLDFLKQTLKTHSDDHDKTQQLLSKQETQLTNFEAQLKAENQRVDSLTAELNMLAQQWKQFALDKSLDAVSAAWFSSEIQTLKQEIANLLTQIQSYNAISESITKKRLQLDKLKSETSKADQKLHELELQLQSLEQEEKTEHSAYEQALHNLAAIKETLHPYFSDASWEEQWSQRPDDFLNDLLTFAEEWKQNAQQLLEAENQFSTLQERLERNAEHYQLHIQSYQRLEEQEERLRSDHETLLEKRKKLFNGEQTSEVSKRLQAAIAKASEQVEQQRSQLEQVKLTLHGTETNLANQQQQLEKSKREKERLLTQLTNWLEQYNLQAASPLSIPQLEALLQHDLKWIKEEQAFFEDFQKRFTTAKTLVNSKQEELHNHQAKKPSDNSFEELVLAKENLESTLKEDQQQLNEAAFTKRTDEQNKNDNEVLIQEISAQKLITDEWAKLNELLGSNDGKKFRTIAQRYTLDYLVRYANFQLKKLTPRYEIKRQKEGLNMAIIDRDMGNEIRAVNTLSGGESFLVSLSLALGLASLNVKNLKIESLFIDEGFGTLDPETLNTAIDALERLQNEGRKVGVISHVAEMSERIGTQIRIEKQGNGKSKIAIV